MNVQSFWAAFMGAAFTIVMIVAAWALYKLVQFVRRTVRTTRELLDALVKLSVAIPLVLKTIQRIAEELTMARSIFEAQAASNGVSPEDLYERARQGRSVVPQESRSAGYAVFPGGPPVGRYEEIPDAKTEDTDMESLSQTDQELAEIEMMESLRQQNGGYIPSEDEDHEPVVSEA